MKETAIADLLREELGDRLLSSSTPSERKVLMSVAPEAIREAVEVLLGKGARFIIIAAIDVGLDVELLYHFDLAGKVVVMRTRLPKENPATDSVADLTPAAEWAEKEAAELCGVSFRAHPKPGHLVLPDEWPEGNFPLGKPFKLKLPDEISPVAEAVVSVGMTAPISDLVERRRAEAGLSPKPPASYSSEPQLKEVHELIKQTSFSERAGYDWERKKLRGVRK